MKLISAFIVIIIFHITYSNLISQPTISVSDSVIIDSTYFDSSYISTNVITNIPDSSFLKRNEGEIVGSLLGALLAGLIAIISILATHQNNKKIQDRRFIIDKTYRENVYCNLLVAVHSELSGHNYFSKQLKKLLPELNRILIEKGELPISKIPVEFSFEFIDECRLKLMDYDYYNVEILNLLGIYQNLTKGLQNNLNISEINNFKYEFSSKTDFEKDINIFFEALLNNLDELNDRRVNLQKLIIEDLDKFPHIYVDKEKLSKQKHEDS